MYEALPKTEFIVEVPNVHNPKYKDKVPQNRVEYNPLIETILNEAKEDGCIWIPYEVTEAKNKAAEEEEAKTN